MSTPYRDLGPFVGSPSLNHKALGAQQTLKAPRMTHTWALQVASTLRLFIHRTEVETLNHVANTATSWPICPHRP